jgi:hypothetical protein
MNLVLYCAVLLGMVWGTFGQQAKATCSNRAIRKEIHDLTKAEWDDFINVIVKMFSDDNGSQVKPFLQAHVSMSAAAHGNPAFLLYHRVMIKYVALSHISIYFYVCPCTEWLLTLTTVLHFSYTRNFEEAFLRNAKVVRVPTFQIVP